MHHSYNNEYKVFSTNFDGFRDNIQSSNYFRAMTKDSNTILNEMFDGLTAGLLDVWYPLSIDKVHGGYYTNLSYDMKLMPEQEKMLVTQARHIWSNARAAKFLGNSNYRDYAEHGFEFLRKHMWDDAYGGFFQMRSRDGNECDAQGFYSEKRTYGNAFAIYGLAALFNLTGDDEVLNLAQKTFNWIEEIAFDDKHGGYFQFFTRKGKLITKDGEFKTHAFDEIESGYKDQNTSIHILEAYTELYNVWPNEKIKNQLESILELTRDTMVDRQGYLHLFFDFNWKPVSFKNAANEEREAYYRLDHVSFGHDYETAFLLLEASHSLGIEGDTRTLITAKKMIDHAIEKGWDYDNGGFYEEGYYFAGNENCTIINDAKNWWSQAEGLNVLLLFSRIFPDEKKYYELFMKLWEYVKTYLIDDEHGDWYWGGIDKQPFHKTTPKGSIWKGTYHNCRALMNCIMMLDTGGGFQNGNKDYKKMKNNFDNMIEHWRQIANLI